MKTVGIIGGIGPESTIEYYKYILHSYRDAKRDGTSPSVIINSIDLKKLLDLAGRTNLGELTDYLVCEVKRLVEAGATLALIAANTPHIVFENVSRQISIPMISIVEATCEVAKSMGLKSLGLFGTRFTMQGGFYQKVFTRENIGITLPDTVDQDYIHGKYLTELVKGEVRPDTYKHLLAIISRMKDNAGIEGLILGGTELSLIFREEKACEIPALNTARIHADKAISWMLL